MTLPVKEDVSCFSHRELGLSRVVDFNSDTLDKTERAGLLGTLLEGTEV